MFVYTLAACFVLVSCVPPPLEEDQSRLSFSIGRFGQRLYANLPYDVTPVIVFSPYSIHSALSMAYLGADGDTADEMKSVLKVSSVSDPHLSHGRLLQSLSSTKDTYIGNSLWFDSDKEILPSYKGGLIEYYAAEVSEIDFNKPGGPEKPINDWVARITKDHVKNIITSEELKKGQTELVLVNTFYVNGRWKKQFSEQNNFKATFDMETGEKIEDVEFMTQSGEFKYRKSALGTSDLLKLELDDGENSLFIILPQSDTSTFVSELNITETDLEELAANVEKTHLTVTIPKFKITTSMKLKNILSTMGMPTAFSDNSTFPGISKRDVKISNVIQKAEIEIKEAGLTAMPSTAVPMGINSNLTTFTADHPFIFGLWNGKTKTLLLAGIMNDPRVSEIEIY